MTDGFDDDAPGYKKPPRWSRFRKGKSGNPAGRPRRKDQPDTPVPSSTPSDDILRRELERKHKLKEGGKSIELSMLEVVTKAQLAAAAKGNPMAQRDVLKRAAELEADDALRTAEARREARETFNLIVDWRKRLIADWETAAGESREPADPWPHPDDIIINRSQVEWTIRGPAHEDDLPLYRYFQAERDWHFSSMILGARRVRTNAEQRVAHALHSFWIAYDRMLPKRWQIATDQLDDLITLIFVFPIEDLEALVKRYDTLRQRLRPEPKPRDRREVYRTANCLMKPILKPMGYRSLAEFEHTFEQQGESMAWPKVAN